jgi:hypothetical protein
MGSVEERAMKIRREAEAAAAERRRQAEVSAAAVRADQERQDKERQQREARSRAAAESMNDSVVSGAKLRNHLEELRRALGHPGSISERSYTNPDGTAVTAISLSHTETKDSYNSDGTQDGTYELTDNVDVYLEQSPSGAVKVQVSPSPGPTIPSYEAPDSSDSAAIEDFVTERLAVELNHRRAYGYQPPPKPKRRWFS